MKVREVLKLIEADGWRMKNQVGSHRQFIHEFSQGKLRLLAMLQTKFLRRHWPIMKQAKLK